MILNDIVENYHFTPTRQIRLGITISYADDLLKAKEILKEILKGEPRITEEPAPVLYVTYLGDNGVELSARDWVENTKYWKARCELPERIKLRFDQEGITIPLPQRHVPFEGKVSLQQEEKARPQGGSFPIPARNQSCKSLEPLDPGALERVRGAARGVALGAGQ